MFEEQDIKNINEDFPVKLYKISHLIDRIHQINPFIPKDDIVLICNVFFEKIREFLLLGNVIKINKLFSKTYIYFYYRNLNNAKQLFFKIKNGKI